MRDDILELLRRTREHIRETRRLLGHCKSSISSTKSRFARLATLSHAGGARAANCVTGLAYLTAMFDAPQSRLIDTPSRESTPAHLVFEVLTLARSDQFWRKQTPLTVLSTFTLRRLSNQFRRRLRSLPLVGSSIIG